MNENKLDSMQDNIHAELYYMNEIVNESVKEVELK